MARRVCYIHAGPHKSGTTAIQRFFQENRPESLQHGYFIPESETMNAIARNILPDRSLAVEAPWNEVAQRSALVSRI
jgi:hypothetical protein